MENNEKIKNLVDFMVREIAKSSYLSTPTQFNDGDTKFQEGRLSALNDIISILMSEKDEL